MSNIMRPLVKGVSIAVLAAGVLVSAAVPIVGCRIGSSHGDNVSVGTVVNVGTDGVIWNRPLMYLLHAGEMKAEEFAIDPSLVVAAEEFALHNTKVRIKYSSSLVCWAWNYAACDKVYSIVAEDSK